MLIYTSNKKRNESYFAQFSFFHQGQQALTAGKSVRETKIEWEDKLSGEFLQSNFPLPASLTTAWLDQ